MKTFFIYYLTIFSYIIVLQYLEQGVYEKVAEYLTLMGRTELLTCLATQNSYGKIRDQAQQVLKINRQYTSEKYNEYNNINND